MVLDLPECFGCMNGRSFGYVALEVLIEISKFSVLQNDAHWIVVEAGSEQAGDVPVGKPSQPLCYFLKFYPVIRRIF